MPVEISLGPIETSAGRMTAAVIRSVSERRMLDEERQRVTWFLKSALESIEDAFVLLDARDRVLLVNSAARHMFDACLAGPSEHWSYAMIVDGSVSQGLIDGADEGLVSVRRRWLDYHRAPVGACMLRARGGRTLRVTERKTAEGGAIMLVADVTDEIARTNELRRAREEADAANAAKSDFLTSMSHELRTPLNAVLGFSQLLRSDRVSPLDARQRDRLAHVLAGGEHLLKLIDDVLDLARIESRRLTIALERVTLQDALGEALAALEPLAARAGVTLASDADAALLHDGVVVDRTRFIQILMNFGSNAIKYGRRGGRATLRVERRPCTVRVSVIDDGVGIPEAYRARIFEPFQRAGQEAGAIEGTGIGLTTSKRLAELMDGAIGFESEEGHGSTFWVEVPSADRDVATAPGERGSDESIRLSGQGPKRLVVYVEDNPSNVAFMRDAFEDFPGLELLTAPSAELGVELKPGA